MKRIRFSFSALAFLAVLGAAATLGLTGCPNKEFKPEDDCAKMTLCTECSSRGGCAWCGNACASTSGTCASGFIKTPDRCPVIPAPAK